MFKIFSIGDHKNPPKPKACKNENELNMKVGKKNTDSQQTFRTEKHEQIVLTCFNMNQNEAG